MITDRDGCAHWIGKVGVVRTISLTWKTEIGLFLVSTEERLDLEKGNSNVRRTRNLWGTTSHDTSLIQFVIFILKKEVLAKFGVSLPKAAGSDDPKRALPPEEGWEKHGVKKASKRSSDKHKRSSRQNQAGKLGWRASKQARLV